MSATRPYRGELSVEESHTLGGLVRRIERTPDDVLAFNLTPAERRAVRKLCMVMFGVTPEQAAQMNAARRIREFTRGR